MLSLTLKSNGNQAIGLERLKPSVDLLLSLQNPAEGWASYENICGPSWLEKLNPSRIFGNIMIEYNYVECSSAVMQGLKKFSRTFPGHRKKEIEHKQGQVFNTARALLGLMAARYPDKEPIERGNCIPDQKAGCQR